MLKTTIAHSLELDSQDAAEEVLEQSRVKLGELNPQAGMLFAGIDHNFELILKKIDEAYPAIQLIGCTTDGEISSVHGFSDDSIVLTLFCSERLSFKASVADKVTKDSVTDLIKAVETAKSHLDQEPKICIVTPTGYPGVITGEDIIEAVRRALGEAIPIFGGLAGDQFRFEGTYQFCNKNVFTDAVPFILISGPLLYSFGVESGWMPIGQKAKVTRSDHNVISRIGDQSAMDFVRHYLGEIAFTPISEFPLAIFEDDGESFCLRSSLATDAEKGSITYTGPIPEGATVQLTHSTRDRIIEAAKASVSSAVAEYPGSKPSIALCFSCTCRKQVLGTRVEEEYMLLKSSYPDLPVAGFYTYGEIGLLNKDKPAKLHNDTFYTLLIGSE